MTNDFEALPCGVVFEPPRAVRVCVFADSVLAARAWTDAGGSTWGWEAAWLPFRPLGGGPRHYDGRHLHLHWTMIDGDVAPGIVAMLAAHSRTGRMIAWTGDAVLVDVDGALWSLPPEAVKLDGGGT